MNKNILHIPSLTYFGNDLNVLQRFLKHRGNPPYHIDGDLDLRHTPIKSLGNLTSVGGYLDLGDSDIESLGNLTSVGEDLNLENTPLSKIMIENDIRSQVNVEGYIYL